MFDFAVSNGQPMAGGPGAGKGSHRKRQAAKARKATMGGAKELKQAAKYLMKAAQRLQGAAPQGGGFGFPSLGGGFPNVPSFGGYGPAQALQLGQSLGGGFAQFAGAPAPQVNFNFNFGGSGGGCNCGGADYAGMPNLAMAFGF